MFLNAIRNGRIKKGRRAMGQNGIIAAKGSRTCLEARAWRRSVYSEDSSYGFELPAQLPQLAEFELACLFRDLSSVISPKLSAPIDIPVIPEKLFYESFPLAFNRSYFFKNLFKCLLTLQICRYHIRESCEFYDLGAGAGPFSLAIARIANLKSLTLIDRSSKQVEMARKIFGIINPDFPVQFEIADLLDFNSVNRDCISSYALGEYHSNLGEIIDKIYLSSSTIIVDSPNFIKLIYGPLKDKGLRLIAGVVNFVAGQESCDIIEGGGGEFAYIYNSGPKQRSR